MAIPLLKIAFSTRKTNPWTTLWSTFLLIEIYPPRTVSSPPWNPTAKPLTSVSMKNTLTKWKRNLTSENLSRVFLTNPSIIHTQSQWKWKSNSCKGGRTLIHPSWWGRFTMTKIVAWLNQTSVSGSAHWHHVNRIKILSHYPPIQNKDSLRYWVLQ